MEMIKMLSLEELREKLYKKYSRKEIAKKLNLSPVQISRILNNKCMLSIDRYKQLIEMI